jgi:GT2 family glycosyltransferase
VPVESTPPGNSACAGYSCVSDDGKPRSISEGERPTSVAVVVPTTHRVENVLRLAQQVRATSPLLATITVVDNCPWADRVEWNEFDGTVVVHRSYLGAEQAFVLGLKSTPTADWYLLLDHDADLHEMCLTTLLATATDTNAVYSANQGGDGRAWNRGNELASEPMGLTTETVAVKFAPWSGLLLNPHAAEVVKSQDSGYFFGWDDYLACWRMTQMGIRIWGVPGAVIGNDRLDDWRSPWRAYYRARNHLLFHRDTGCGDMATILRARGTDLYGAFADRRRDRASAMARGFVDGLMNRRGARMVPS